MTAPWHYGDGMLCTRTLEMLHEAVRYNAWVFSWIEPFLGASNVEIGAGHGTLTEHALERHAVLVTEPATSGQRELAARFLGHPNLLGIHDDFLTLEATGKVDCVYSANVLEHVADDIMMLEHAARVLRPGGRFVAVVPAGLWLYSRLDALAGHYRRYTRADRIRLEVELAQRGIPLELVSFSHRNPVGALGWFSRMRLLGLDHIDRGDVRRVEALVPWLRHLDRFESPFGQSLVIGLKRR